MNDIQRLLRRVDSYNSAKKLQNAGPDSEIFGGDSPARFYFQFSMPPPGRPGPPGPPVAPRCPTARSPQARQRNLVQVYTPQFNIKSSRTGSGLFFTRLTYDFFKWNFFRINSGYYSFWFFTGGKKMKERPGRKTPGFHSSETQLKFTIGEDGWESMGYGKRSELLSKY